MGYWSSDKTNEPLWIEILSATVCVLSIIIWFTSYYPDIRVREGDSQQGT